MPQGAWKVVTKFPQEPYPFYLTYYTDADLDSDKNVDNPLEFYNINWYK